MKLPRNKLKKNKYMYCELYTEYLKSQIVDTNLGPYHRYILYRDTITPMYKMKLKNRKRKGLK